MHLVAEEAHNEAIGRCVQAAAIGHCAANFSGKLLDGARRFL
jgi:hypothetical protein